MARRCSLIISVLVLLLAAPAWLSAQQQPAPPPSSTADDTAPPSYETPPAITVVDGSARLTRQGQSQTAVANMPLIEGDRLATDNGRVAVTFPDGSLLHIDRNTTIDFLSLSLMRLHGGNAILVAAGRGGERPSVDYQIDAPSGSVRLRTTGEYHVSARAGEVELDVVSGTAALATDQGSVDLNAGERSFARSGAPPDYPQTFNSARLDAFDEWSEQQRDLNVGSQSEEYLPSELDTYASTFDHYGRWDYAQPYGYVWYPTVPVGWRPYYNGYWDNVGPYGWTWIGYDRWAWPTHHWGRWGFNAGAWFWIPSHHWGPAWVSWGFSAGYIGWCPLDYYNRSLVSLTFGYGYAIARPLYDPWLCWTVVPHGRFGHGYRVAPYAVPGGRLPATVRAGFAVGRQGPDRSLAAARAGVAVPRGGALGAAVPRALPSVTMQARPREAMFASSRAVPRGGAPGVASNGASVASRRDSRSLPYAPAPAARADRSMAVPRGQASSSAYPGAAVPRASAGAATRYENRPPTASARSRAYGTTPSDRPAAGPRYQAQPRTYSAPREYAPSTGAQSARSRGDTSSPRYSPPARSTPYAAPRPPSSSSPGNSGRPSYSAPRYSAPAAPRYSAPQYSAPAAPRYSAPQYSAPAAPRYSAPQHSAPAAPRYSAPPSGGYAAPRSGGGASHAAPSGGSARPAPSGGQGRGGGRGR